VLHSKKILSPVLEHCSVTSISNQFMRVLCYGIVQIVLNHKHNCLCLLRLAWVLRNRSSIHFIIRTEAIHIDTPISVELVHELFCQYSVVSWLEVTKSIANG